MGSGIILAPTHCFAWLGLRQSTKFGYYACEKGGKRNKMQWEGMKLKLRGPSPIFGRKLSKYCVFIFCCFLQPYAIYNHHWKCCYQKIFFFQFRGVQKNFFLAPNFFFNLIFSSSTQFHLLSQHIILSSKILQK